MSLSKYGLFGLVAIGITFLGFVDPQQPKTSQHAYTYRGDVLPLLQANCNPCHFPGGKVYKKLPFDDSTTVARLGKKLNTRLQKKEQQEIVNEWIKNGIGEKK